MLQNLILLTVFQLSGEMLVFGLGLLFPGPLCGMLMLLAYLCAVNGPSDDLRTVGKALIRHLGLLFVPAGTAIVLFGDLLLKDGAAIAVALIVSTAAAIMVAGCIGSRFGRPFAVRSA